MNPTITFTEAASSYIRKVLDKNHGVGFRLSIKKTGCSGYSYVPVVIDKIVPNDISFVIAQEITVYLDPAWLEMLQGITVDCIEDEKSGIKQKRLVFINPKEASRCGCGESFHIE